ncbi:asparagine synthase (glutamine-hydrolyzing) [Fulvivirgaceae bacterium PWU4]|uniref:asparagine synthase (glutamine-hydrolyzing) n=1 Tax=Chryseosolibacter histidini TaxID=2782349 RepID=A0AAP2GS15_9BACT|nr:asparagine synthase (glutamine-hydrolyzing) [Chryseosolibacter histidini]MBT1700222.1 asparagine synthase (glutamine-hydrolyzing) [Chryseosolibacter histidini]
MCGITGILAFNLVGKFNKIHVTAATMSLEKRGPDYQDIYIDEWVGLGHRRLSIIDTSSVAHQPMWDESKRYCIVFNGEIFNYRELKKDLLDKGVTFFSQSDTEVLLKLYLHYGEQCLAKLNGFFAFCIYDKQQQTFFVARDRYGIKPLLYLYDDDKFIFASEMKTMLKYGIDRPLDYSSLHSYLQLNYIPAPDTIFTTVKKLLPGHYLKVGNKKLSEGKYYDIPYSSGEAESNPLSYDQAREKLKTLLEASVQRRLVADVPLGAFLSGGIDSSVVTALASKHKPDLHTFSIGFRDEKFFDETEYARLVAKQFNTEHTVFSLTNDDLYAHVSSILDYIDEPFADSSAINVYILSKETRKHATVALSGDGADELLGGYNKHAAFYSMAHPGLKENVVSALHPLWKVLPQSRNGAFSNKLRQAARFAEGARLSPAARYWRWASYATENGAYELFSAASQEKFHRQEYESRKQALMQTVPDHHTMNDILLTDMKVVLPNDMLTKVDLMSMANGLEVRVPFLDYEVVNFAFSLPSHYKINKSMRKRILQDAYRDVLPAKLYNRPKKGFEVPLLKWFRKEMRSLIMDDLLAQKKIEEQGIFNYAAIDKLKRQLFSSNPGDVHARIWGLIVFQWWRRRFEV